MRREDLGRRAAGEDPEEVGDEAVPVVRAHPRRGNLWPVLAVGMSDDPDGWIDWSEGIARWDDGFWSRVAFRMPFSWQWFLNWWVSRRYVEPRDVRRR